VKRVDASRIEILLKHTGKISMNESISKKCPFDFDVRNLAGDLTAALTMALISVPDAIASALLAGVSPIYGMNAMMIGMPVAGFFTSSQFMNVNLTAAMMLITANALAGYSGDAVAGAMMMLAVLTGAFMVIMGVLKLGRMTRFVSNAVMTGFFTGVAVTIILGQLGGLTGYASPYDNNVRAAVDLFRNLGAIDPPSLAIGLLTIFLIVVLAGTRLRAFSLIIAMLAASIAVAVLGWDVHLVGDSYAITGQFPLPALPDFSAIPVLLIPAFALALVGVIQGAGVSQGVPNPDGRYPDVSRDFIGQGIANLASGLFQGLPVGGSLGGTAVSMKAGAKSRWVNIFAGLMFIALVLLFAPQVEKVAEPAIAAVLIMAGIEIIRRDRIRTVWVTGMAPKVVMILTFVLTLFVPAQWAILIGVLVSIGLHIYFSAMDVRVVALKLTDDGGLEEQAPPDQLSNETITVLSVYGNMFFAAASNLEDKLPQTQNSQRSVVILRMRGLDNMGSTYISVLDRYSKALQAHEGKLLLAEVSAGVLDQLERTGLLAQLGEENVFPETPRVYFATRQAFRAAQSWLAVPVV
jgi:sulfate permease, SulP family